MWNERYRGDEHAYGTEPNDFLKEVLLQLPPGRALCLADGEGRNGVFLAENGFEVVAVDQSDVGLLKAQQLAGRRGVSLQTVQADLSDFDIGQNEWDVIVSIWCHLPVPLRQRVHRSSVAGLRAEGAFVLEAYSPRQLQFGTGGPPVVELLMELEALREELIGLTWMRAQEVEREVLEGKFHTGRSAVVQMLGFKKA